MISKYLCLPFLRCLKLTSYNRISCCSYVHRLMRNRTDGKLVELPSATTLTTSASSISLDRLNAATISATKGLGFGPSTSDELKMAQLENITLEYSAILSTQLSQQKQRYEKDVQQLQGELTTLRQKAVDGEAWRKKYILMEDKERAVTVKVVPDLERAKVQAEEKVTKVS